MILNIILPIKITELRLWYLSCIPVTQGRHIQPQLLLPVPLIEELLHAPGRPLLVQVPGLGGVSHVCRVEHERHYLGLIVEIGLYSLQLSEMERHV